jgi:hypothetical protein
LSGCLFACQSVHSASARTSQARKKKQNSTAFPVSLARRHLVHAAGLARAAKQPTNHFIPACDGPCTSRSSLPITPFVNRWRRTGVALAAPSSPMQMAAVGWHRFRGSRSLSCVNGHRLSRALRPPAPATHTQGHHT